MHRRLISACCAATLALLGAPTVRAAPPTDADAEPPSAPSDADSGDESDAATRVDQAIEAWRKGEWTEVRDLLEPLVRESDEIEDELLLESALRYLAEATLLDEGLDPVERRELARGYITRLLESSPDWTPPSGLHGRAFYDLAAQIRSERDADRAEKCAGALITCEVDLEELEAEHEVLQAKYDAEEVAVVEVIKRNRGLAFLPLGVGHFTNGNYAIGGTFLALEVATGAAGLGLLLYRTSKLGCVRTNGFATESLVCTLDGREEEDLPRLQDHVQNVRNAEAVMGYLFLGSIVLDIVLAQVLFRPNTVVDKGTKTREELENQTPTDGADRRRTRRKTSNAKLEIRPSPAFVPGGAGFGVSLRF